MMDKALRHRAGRHIVGHYIRELTDTGHPRSGSKVMHADPSPG